MAIRKLHSVQCRCGEQLRISLAESVNVDRAPDIRAEILAGTFHKIRCPACGNSFTAETTFQYIDTRRGDYFLVRPRGHRHQWRETETIAEQAAGCWPKSLLGEEPRVRVMFGMDELRETLVAENAGL